MSRIKAESTEVKALTVYDRSIFADFRTPGGTGHDDALHTGVDVAGNVCIRIEEDGDLVFGEVVLSPETFRELARKILDAVDQLEGRAD